MVFGRRNPLKSLTKAKKAVTKQSKAVMGGAKSATRTAIKGAKVAKAAGGIAADVMNPYKMGKVAVNAARGKGVVYPGSKYIGPGNPMNRGKGTSSADRAAYKHDVAYGKYLDKGVKPMKLYAGYSEADKKLMKDSDVTTKHGLVTYGGMAVKKGMYKLGLSGKMIR